MSKGKKKVEAEVQDDFEASLRGDQTEAPEVPKKEIVYDTFTLGVLNKGDSYEIVKIPISSEHGVTGPFEILETGLSARRANNELKLKLVKHKVVK